MGDFHNNPYIGLRTYEESDTAFFRGRETASTELFRMIEDDDVVVLHAESGEGKSSVLNAGLVPILRDERYLPIKINFTEEDFKLENPDFDQIVLSRIENVVYSAGKAGHRLTLASITSENNIAEKLSFLKTNIWWLLRNYAPSAYGAVLMPVLIFDQFEEIFTRPNSIAWTESFFIWLSNTIGDAVPQELKLKIRESIGEDADFPKLPTTKKFKALFSLRTEFIGELDYWAVQRHKIYALKNSRYCLKPLTEKEANEVLELQPAFDDSIKQQIKKSICLSKLSGKSASNLPNFPAMLLSVVCSTASENLDNAVGLNNTPSVSGVLRNNDFFDNIILQFYKKEIEAAKIPKKALKHIESVLVDDKGKRVRIKSDNKELREIHFEEKYKKILEERRLIKSSQISGGMYVELTHDALAKVIVQQRAKKTDKKEWTIQLVLYGIGVLLMVLGIGYWNNSLVFESSYIGTGEYRFLTHYGFSPHYWLKQLVRASIYAIIGAAVFYLSKNKPIGVIKTIQLLGYSILLLLSYWVDILKLFVVDFSPLRAMFSLLFLFCFFLGNTICRRNNWVKYIGYLLIIVAFIPVILSIKLLASIALFIISLFYFGAYIYTREKNIIKTLPIAIITMFISVKLCYFYNSPYYLGDAEYLLYIFFALGIWGAFLTKTRSFSDTIKYIFTGQLHKEYPFILKALYTFLFCMVACLVIELGRYLNIKISLVALPIISIVCYFLYNRIVLISKSVKYNIAIAGTVAFSVLLIGLSQLVLYHGSIVVAICCISGGLLYLLNSKVTEADGKKIGLVKASVLWVLLIVIMPFVGFGFNLLNGNNTRLAGLNRIDTYVGAKLLYTKNSDNLMGVRDRYGNMVIPCEYDSVEYRRGYSLFLVRTDMFLLTNGNLHISWFSYEHLNELNELTDNLYKYVIEGGRAHAKILKYIIPAMKVRNESPEYYNKVAELYTNSLVMNRILNSPNSSYYLGFDKDNPDEYINFNINNVDTDTRFIKKAKHLSYDEIDLSMLPYASEAYIEKFIDKVYSNSYLVPSVSVGEATSKSLWEWYSRLVSSNSLSNCLKDLPNSDEIHIRDYAEYRLGDLYTRLASLYVETGRYNTAKEFMNKAFLLPYTEPVRVDFYVMSLLNGKTVQLEEIYNKQQQLIRVDGLEYPHSNISGAWERLEYNTLYELIEKRLQYLYNNQLGDIKKIKKAQELLASIERAPQPSIPYNYIQIIPDSLGGGLRYRGSTSDGFIDYSSWNHSHAEHLYDYFVKDGEVVCPPIFWYTLPEDKSESPTLVIELLSKKRRYIKDGQNVLFKSSGIPEFLPGEYDHAWAFSEGMAAVEVGGKIGFINEAGEMVIEPQFTSSFPTSSRSFISADFNIYKSQIGKGRYLEKPYFKDGTCPVYVGDELIMIDKTGNRVR